ncbi:MAG: UDP-N-acetylmuramoyl-tripeptide--D-alanyl-D-alanine ligase [Pseudohongiellaceae bacterium]|nr:UDP-N-acetylmuramoyl-tripeptide--D-alanyl-D-alanine ligase [Pseudohongiellaceae bacterium]
MIHKMQLSSIAQSLDGKLHGNDASFERVCTDTRTLQKGDLYIALVGENFNGNHFVESAAANGACAAIVSELSEHSLPQLEVVDTTKALGGLAKLNRLASAARVAAITGSQGKTSVKEMLGKIMSCVDTTLVTQGNFNNHIGVPLTLMDLAQEHEFAVIELGASGPGEIAYTVDMVKPDVCVITNAAETHVEGFGSLQGVVETKGEIIDGVQEDGVVVLNASDANFAQWLARAGAKKVVTFAVQLNESTVQSDYLACDVSNLDGISNKFVLRTPIGEVDVQLALPGNHNVANAAAAAAVAIEMGASLSQVKEGLSKVNPVPGRLAKCKGIGGFTLIDDSYNASPSSFKAAIDVLAANDGKKVLIMGDMGELGEKTTGEHRAVGQYAAQAKINELWAVGKFSALAAKSFGVNGKHFESQDALVEFANDNLDQKTVALVKGSRSAAMDNIVKRLKSGELA